MGNKKGQVDKLDVLVIIILIVSVLVLAIPLIKDSISSADDQVHECNNPTYSILNETISPPLCCNQTNCAGNESVTYAGLTGSQETMLGLIVFVLIMGVVYYGGKVFGFI